MFNFIKSLLGLGPRPGEDDFNYQSKRGAEKLGKRVSRSPSNSKKISKVSAKIVEPILNKENARNSVEFEKMRFQSLLGNWKPYDGVDTIKGSRLPRNIDFGDAAEYWKDLPEKAPFSDFVFPAWLRTTPAYAGFLVKKITSGDLYKEKHIPREGKKPRVIDMPAPVLKYMQKRILQRILKQIHVHDAAHGFVSGRSIFTAANPHVGQRMVVAMDLRDFFGTITFKRVVGMFKAYGIEQKQALLLAGLCCYRGRLPQGAPTSPMISNIICRKLDARLTGLASHSNFKYSRYADDLIFSGPSSLIRFIPIIQKIIQDEGFELAEEKKRIKRSGSRQQVLGLNVNSKVSVPRKVRRLLRAMAHRQINAQNPDNDLVSFIRGHLSFMNPAHPKMANELLVKMSGL